MSTLPNIDTLSPAELAKLKAQIASVEAKQAEAKNAFRDQLAKTRENMEKLERLAAAAGLGKMSQPVQAVHANGNGKHPGAPATTNGKHPTPAPVKAKSPRKPKIAIRFRDPAHPQNTWTGRGRPARWLAEAEAAGRKREEFRVG